MITMSMFANKESYQEAKKEQSADLDYFLDQLQDLCSKHDFRLEADFIKSGEGFAPVINVGSYTEGRDERLVSLIDYRETLEAKE